MSDLLPVSEAERCEPQAGPRPGIASYPARRAELGGGLGVIRALPLKTRRLVGPWCFFDAYGPLSFAGKKAMNVAPHPHIGLQTVSWLFAGEVLHHDSLGFEALARPGQLNLMTAGAGIAHSEQTPPGNSGRLYGVQLWVALPDGERHRPPSFEHHWELPVIEPGGGRARLFMGELAGERSPARAFSPLVGAELEVRGRLALPLNPVWEHALVLIEGALELDGRQLAPGALHYLGTHREELALAAAQTTRAVLIGGAPFSESIIIWWNFVARTAEEIRAAREDWEGHRRFGEVKAYRGERLEAPAFIVSPLAGR